MSQPVTPPPSAQPAPPLSGPSSARWPAGLVVAVVLAALLAAGGLVVLLRAPATAAAAPPPPSVAPAPMPEQTGPVVPGLPGDPPTEFPTDPVGMLVTLFDANPTTEGRFSEDEIRQMARWACRRIAAWEGDVGQARLRLWEDAQRRYGLSDMTGGAILTGVLEPICSDGRGDAV